MNGSEFLFWIAFAVIIAFLVGFVVVGLLGPQAGKIAVAVTFVFVLGLVAYFKQK